METICKYMEIYGNIWIYNNIYGNIRNCMIMLGVVWQYNEVSEMIGKCMEIYGNRSVRKCYKLGICENILNIREFMKIYGNM